MLEAFNAQFCCEIVWALPHSIWQAAIIALLLGTFVRQVQPCPRLERIPRVSKPRVGASSINLVLVIGASILVACVMIIGYRAVVMRALSDAERVAIIEEKHGELGEHADGVFEKGVTNIRGRITTEDGGEVEGLFLYSRSERSDNVGRDSVKSEFESEFVADQEFDVSVESGFVWLKFFSKNYTPAIVGPIKALKDQSITQDVNLLKGTPHLIHVVDEDGQPVSGAKVIMYPKSNGGHFGNNVTDDLGNYTFKHRNPGGESSLRVEKLGYSTEEMDVINIGKTKLALKTIPGYITKEMDVINNGKTKVAVKTAPISKGLVLSANGTPVADAQIRLVAAGRWLSFNDHELIATTDEQGRFETPKLLPTETYRILVVSDEGMVVVDEVTVSDDLKFTLGSECSVDISIKGDLDQLYRGKKDGKLVVSFEQRVGRQRVVWRIHEEKEVLEIVEDSEDQVRLKLKRLLPGKFFLRSGKFVRPIEAKPGNHSVEFTASSPSRKVRWKVKVVEEVDIQVRFECDGEPVKPGGSIWYNHTSYPLSDGVLKMKAKPGRRYLQPYWLIGFTFDGQEIEVKAGEANEFTIEVDRAGAVAGRFVDVDGEPVSAPVSCRYQYQTPDGNRSWSLNRHYWSDDEGKFLLTPIPLGAKVVVKAGDRVIPVVSDELLIEASNPLVEVRLQTSRPAKAKVRVVDHQGKPIPGVDLTIRSAESGWWSRSRSRGLLTDSEGEVVVSPLHPTWDYDVSAGNKNGYVKGFVPKIVDLVQGETNILQLEPGCVVRGQLLDKSGNPVPERAVKAWAVDDALPLCQRIINADRITDAEGRFEFTKLPKAEFKIIAFTSETLLSTAMISDGVIVDAGVDDSPIELRTWE